MSDAVAELKSALDHDESCSRAHYFMGLALARIADRDKEALRHMERAATLEPNNAVMLAEAAALALKVGMRAKAQRLAEEALTFDPTNDKAAKVLRASSDEDPSASGNGGLLGRLRRRG